MQGPEEPQPNRGTTHNEVDRARSATEVAITATAGAVGTAAAEAAEMASSAGERLAIAAAVPCHLCRPRSGQGWDRGNSPVHLIHLRPWLPRPVLIHRSPTLRPPRHYNRRKSVSGAAVMCGDASIQWISRMQKTSTLSTSEAGVRCDGRGFQGGPFFYGQCGVFCCLILGVRAFRFLRTTRVRSKKRSTP